ncbi:restriction endonuclease subunit S [Klebsiella michiganensis]|uniref:restriction endonuclease subunit S n=1 Tax=Klebsiella michiganensis TaxID=1134687 RepID=UPI0015E9FA60|nr:restriction endonuclease subunit S [Klebsiella michiganensis]QMR56877.1 restriction endonuclease subunit S [Klebsiella michiganensis]
MNEWIKTTLAEIADIRVSNVDKKSYQGERAVMLCNYMDVYSNDYITRDISFMEATANIMEIAKFTVSKGDVLITKDSETPFDIGIPAVVEEDIDNLICGYHLAQLRPDENKVDSVFLAKKLAMPDVASYFSRVAAGSTRYGLSNGAIANTIISIPPLKKQKKISHVLKCLDSTLARTEELIKKYQQIKVGMMHDLFTRGIDADGKLRPHRNLSPGLYQKTSNGWFPKDWQFSRLGDALLRIDSGWSPACYETPPGIGEWGVLKVSAVTKGYYDFSESKTLPMNLKPIPSIEVKNEDVIMTRANGVAELVGKCVQVWQTQDKLMLSDKLLRLVPNDYMLKGFLYHLMCSNDIVKQIVKAMSGSSGQRNISQSEIKNFLCPIPSIDEQHMISNILLAYDKLIEREKIALAKMKKYKHGLMQDLLTGKVAVRVKLKNTEASHV